MISSQQSQDFKRVLLNGFKNQGTNFNTLMNSIFQSLIANKPQTSTKFQKLLDEADEGEQSELNEFYNTLLKLVVQFFKERAAESEIEFQLQQLGLPEDFNAAFILKYRKFSDYIESSDSDVNKNLIGEYSMLDFSWEMNELLPAREDIFEKQGMVIGTLLYLHKISGNVKKMKFLIPMEMAEKVGREIKQALLACDDLIREYNE